MMRAPSNAKGRRQSLAPSPPKRPKRRPTALVVSHQLTAATLLELIHLPLSFLLCDAVLFQQQPFELVAAPLGLLHFVVGEISPPFPNLTRKPLPIAFHRVPVHDSSPREPIDAFKTRAGAPGSVQSKAPIP